ncbi:MAG: DUF4852 domain-containing protein [Alphaproteobacteria bacterium]
MLLRLFLLAFFSLSFAAGDALAQNAAGSTAAPATVADDYADLTWPNLVRTLVRFNAINIADPVIIDEYAIITECDLYKAFYHDDFKWNQVRKAVHESIKMNVSTYPVNYRYSVTIQLGRYDFTAKLFRFNKLTKMTNVNTFKMFAVNNRSCGADNVKSLPHNFRVVLTEPIFLEGLPLSEKDSETMLRRMEDDGNTNRLLYTRFNLRIVYIDPLRKQVEGTGPGATTLYLQHDFKDYSDIRLDARLDSIDFYTDPAMTHLVYEYAPY